MRSKIGGVAVELIGLRQRVRELEPVARRVTHLERLVKDLEAEALQLRRLIYASSKIKRQRSGRRHERDTAESVGRAAVVCSCDGGDRAP